MSPSSSASVPISAKYSHESPAGSSAAHSVSDSSQNIAPKAAAAYKSSAAYPMMAARERRRPPAALRYRKDAHSCACFFRSSLSMPALQLQKDRLERPVAAHLRHRPGADEPPLPDDGDPVAELLRHLEHMRREENRTAAAARSRIRSLSRCAAPGSSPTNGSSMTSSFGSCRSAEMTASFCFMPWL